MKSYKGGDTVEFTRQDNFPSEIAKKKWLIFWGSNTPGKF